MQEQIDEIASRIANDLIKIKNNFGNDKYAKNRIRDIFAGIIFDLEDMAEFFDIDLFDEIDEINQLRAAL